MSARTKSRRSGHIAAGVALAVMYAGRIVERAPTARPYTEALLAALPRLDTPPHTPLAAISGRLPDPTRPLVGCPFAPRCRYRDRRCDSETPVLAASATIGHACA
jgi:peptide/nickel transport system ATP-binding protein